MKEIDINYDDAVEILDVVLMRNKNNHFEKVIDTKESLQLKISYARSNGSFGVVFCNSNYNLEPCWYSDKHNFHHPGIMLVTKMITFLVEYDQENKKFKIYKQMSGSFIHHYDQLSFPDLQEEGKELPILCGLRNASQLAIFSFCDKKSPKKVIAIATINEYSMHQRSDLNYYKTDEEQASVVGFLNCNKIMVHNEVTNTLKMYQSDMWNLPIILRYGGEEYNTEATFYFKNKLLGTLHLYFLENTFGRNSVHLSTRASGFVWKNQKTQRVYLPEDQFYGNNIHMKPNSLDTQVTFSRKFFIKGESEPGFRY